MNEFVDDDHHHDRVWFDKCRCLSARLLACSLVDLISLNSTMCVFSNGTRTRPRPRYAPKLFDQDFNRDFDCYTFDHIIIMFFWLKFVKSGHHAESGRLVDTAVRFRGMKKSCL